MIIGLFKILFWIIVLGAAAIVIYIWRQPKEKIEVMQDDRTKAKLLEMSEKIMIFEIEVPYKNVGGEEGVILDAYTRVYLPEEQYADLQIRGKVNLLNVPRGDDYFEAFIVKASSEGELRLTFEATPKNNKSMRAAILGMPNVDIAIILELRGREDLYSEKKVFTLTAKELKKFVEEN